MYGYPALKWLEGTIPPTVLLLILWGLLEPRYSRRTARFAAAGFLAAELSVQGVIYALSGNPEMVFTLLPLTLYLPAIVGVHLLSRRRFVPTAVSWLLAAQKLLTLLGTHLDKPVWLWTLEGVLLLAAAGLVAVIFCFFRKSFHACVEELDGSWLPLLFPLVMLLALHSYFLSDTTNVTVPFLLLLIAAAVFWTLVQLMTALPGRQQAKENRLQMEALRRDYELLQKKLELGRSCRHDTRRHVLALSALLRQGDCSGALQYMENWQGQLTRAETRSWCRSAAVNAVLSAYLAGAEEARGSLDAEAPLPEEFPVEELDLCVVLANALENAVHACQAAPEGAPRQIKQELALTDHRRLSGLSPAYCPG